jgi:proliferating cell nuclear antigen
MKVTIDKLSVFKDLISTFGSLVEDATFKFTPSGMSVLGMDSSHISMSELNLSKDFFSSYEVNDNVNIAIHLSSLNMVLKTVSGILELSNEKQDLLTIRSKSKTGTVGEIQLKLMALECDELEAGDMAYAFTKEFKSVDFKQFVETVVAFGDELHFEITSDHLSVMAEGDVGKKTETMKLDNMEIDDLEFKSFKNKFSANYITRFLSAAKAAKQVTVMLGEGMPVSMIFKFDGGFIKFFLAPKMEDI